MGEVYRARDSRLDRDVAIKVLPEHLSSDPEALARFEREAKAVAALSHPNILAIHDFGVEHGISFAVTELLEGETLRSRIRDSGLPWRKAVEIASEVAEGLSAAHSKGIIHRDVKPENIFLTAEGRVKVLDFGLARQMLGTAAVPETTTPTATEPGLIMGTIGYMSPEQLRGAWLDAPSDVFSLGCVLYEMVTGRRAFGRATAVETLAAILKEEPAEWGIPAGAAPLELRRLIGHCLEKNPLERFQSVRDLAFNLRSLGSEATIAVPAESSEVIDSLAVLPFANASGDPDTEYLSDGITESLINSLSQIPRLRVVPRSSAFRYKAQNVDPKKAGRQLKVQALLMGKVLQRGDALNVQAELVDVRREAQQLWGERFVRKGSDIFAVQDEIARQITEKLRLRLTGEERDRLIRRYTEDTEAYHLYLKGRYYWNKRTRENLKKGVGYFEQAIARDAGYALPYAGLADAYLVLCFFDGGLPKDLLSKGKAAALRALEIDQDLPEAHAALGLIEVCLDRAWAAAENRYRNAIDTEGAYWLTHNHYALLLAAQGRFEEALGEVRRGNELEPLSLVVHHHLAWVSLLARRYKDTITTCRKALEMEPNFGLAYLWMGIDRLQVARPVCATAPGRVV
jgi:serine/threonine protein kinase